MVGRFKFQSVISMIVIAFLYSCGELPQDLDDPHIPHPELESKDISNQPQREDLGVKNSKVTTPEVYDHESEPKERNYQLDSKWDKTPEGKEILSRVQTFLNWHTKTVELHKRSRQSIVEKYHMSDAALDNYINWLSHTGHFSNAFIQKERAYFENEYYQYLMNIKHIKENGQKVQNPPFGLVNEGFSKVARLKSPNCHIHSFNDGKALVKCEKGGTITLTFDSGQWKIDDWSVLEFHADGVRF